MLEFGQRRGLGHPLDRDRHALLGQCIEHLVGEHHRELNRSSRRKLPDIVPMPFASRQWRSLVADNAKTARCTYETAVVATLRERLRAGDVSVGGNRDYRRFDAYLPGARSRAGARRGVSELSLRWRSGAECTRQGIA